MGFSSDWLGGDETDVVRSAEEIAVRTLALGAAVAISLDADREQTVAWLKATGISSSLTSREKKFVFALKPPEREFINFSWRAEALTVLLWALKKFEALPPANEQCSTAAIEDVLAPFNGQTVEEFVSTAARRGDEELLEMAFELQNLHSLARSQALQARSTEDEPEIDREVIQERHHAINWIVGYCGQDWEEISTDT